MRIAIFSDIHGKFLLPFLMADHWQRQTGERIHLILQCGDLGAFPDPGRVDKATLRHMAHDRDELGFSDQFVKRDPQLSAYLDALGLQMICVRGNHEDHDFLDQLETQHPDAGRFPIDAYGKVWVCRTGVPQQWEAEDQRLSFAGIGRIGDRKGRNEKRFIQDYERAQLRQMMRTTDELDVLLTHDRDHLGDAGHGMKEIREVLDRVMVQYHFHGHTGHPFSQRTDDNGITQTVKVKELEFLEDGLLPPGCMVLLEKRGPADFNLRVVEESFTRQFTRHGWRWL